MTIARHTCFADGEHRLGSYMDCPKCWGALEQSVELASSEGTFTGDEPPAENSMEHSPVISPSDARRCPWCPGHPVYGATEHELSVIRDHVRNVHPDHYLGWAGIPWVHQTTADTEPDDASAGGRWVVSCTCGWSKDGHYARDGGEAVALRLANLVGRKHEEYPEEP